MADWLKEMQEQADRENLAAIRAEFARCVAEEGMADTKESWVAFIHGWFGTRRFSAARKELNDAGQGSYMLMVMCWLFGGLIFGMSVLAYFTFPRENLAVDRLPWMALTGIVLIGLGFLCIKRLKRLHAEALAAHRAKWGNPDDER